MKKRIVFALLTAVCINHLSAVHIAANKELPGIISLFAFRPETGDIIKLLVRTLLTKESTIERRDRQLIAAYVSWLNECAWCCNVHSSVAVHLGFDKEVLQAVKDDYETASIAEKLKAFLAIAQHVQLQARAIPDDVIARARNAGATDLEIHDVVLIAAVFCMNNRYVMCLNAWTPSDPALYDAHGQTLAAQR